MPNPHSPPRQRIPVRAIHRENHPVFGIRQSRPLPLRPPPKLRDLRGIPTLRRTQHHRRPGTQTLPTRLPPHALDRHGNEKRHPRQRLLHPRQHHTRRPPIRRQRAHTPRMDHRPLPNQNHNHPHPHPNRPHHRHPPNPLHRRLDTQLDAASTKPVGAGFKPAPTNQTTTNPISRPTHPKTNTQSKPIIQITKITVQTTHQPKHHTVQHRNTLNNQHAIPRIPPQIPPIHT